MQTVYLFAWIMILRIDEALSLTFENINSLPSERMFLSSYMDMCSLLMS